MLAFLVMLAASAPSTAATAANPENAIVAAVSHCLGSFSAKLPKVPAAGDVPPGLIEGAGVSVIPIGGAVSNAFAYEGTRPRVMSCGVAVYGPIDKALHQNLIDVINKSGKYEPQPVSIYGLLKRAPGAEEEYWGDPRGPSMVGVAMLTRKPSAEAPTVEIEYHAVMVQ